MTTLTNEEEELLSSVLEATHQEIPVNSESLTITTETSRFSSAIWYEEIQKQQIIIAGMGGIGSWLSLLLARMKPATLYLYDDDKVEEVNMAGQLYKTDDVGLLKTTAIGNTLKKYANYYNTFARCVRYDEGCSSNNIMMCGFDNMAARKTFFNVWHNHTQIVPDPSKCLFIDGRLNAEEYQVLAIQGNDERAIKEYKEKWLFDDSEVEEAVCSYKQTTFMANMIASTMANIFVNFIANRVGDFREVPFFTYYNASQMYTKVIS